jgi:hypothetical protein
MILQALLRYCINGNWFRCGLSVIFCWLIRFKNWWVTWFTHSSSYIVFKSLYIFRFFSASSVNSLLPSILISSSKPILLVVLSSLEQSDLFLFWPETLPLLCGFMSVSGCYRDRRAWKISN